MGYRVDPNAKNVWVRDHADTEDLSVTPNASSVYFNNGRTMEQEFGKGTMLSNIATVDSGMEKVIDGTYDGAHESCKMYGKSFVNGLSNPEIRQGGAYITMVSPTHLIINHGENLTENKIIVYYDWFGGKMEDGADYTLDVWILKNTMHRKTDPNASIGKINFNDYNSGFYSIPSNTLGHITYEVTTSKTSTVVKPYIETFTTCEGELEIQMVVRQGKNLAPIEQHFEGLCDVKMPILKNVGNLFDPKKLSTSNTFTYSELTNVGRFEFTNRGDVALDSSIQLPAGTYNLSFRVRGECENGRVAITFKKDGQAWYGCERMEINYNVINPTNFKEVKSTRTFDAPVTVTLVGHGWAGGATGSGWCEFKDILFTSIDKTSILTTPEQVVLRKVGDVCDSYDALTGEHVQRIGEVVLDGSEDWVANSTLNTTKTTFFYLPNPRIPSTWGRISAKWRCLPNNRFVSTEDRRSAVNQKIEWISGGDGSTGMIQILINTERLSTPDVSGFKQWLSQNPVTVQYELEVPITTTIEPSTIPFVYENGHIILESGYEGQSLLPTLEYQTVVSRSGQVAMIDKTIQQHERKITLLEKMLVQNIIDIEYKNTLLALKLEINEVI